MLTWNVCEFDYWTRIKVTREIRVLFKKLHIIFQSQIEVIFGLLATPGTLFRTLVRKIKSWP